MLNYEPGLAVWVIVVFIAVLIVLSKTAWPVILKMIDEREAKLRASLEDAEKVRREVERISAEYEKMIAKARDESEEIIKQGREQAEKIREELVVKAKDEAKAIVDRTIRELELERDKAISELKERAVNLSVAIAARIITSQLTPEKQTELAQRALKEMESA